MQAAVQTRIVVYTVIAGCVIYDLCAIAFGWRTITATVRIINQESGWLVALGWCGLALHFFLADFCALVTAFLRGL